MPNRNRPEGNNWKVRLICCGYEQSPDYAETWERANAVRAEWNASAFDQHERVAIVEAAPHSPTPDVEVPNG